MIYVLAVLGAFLAGCINTLAGNGSAITLYILMETLGLPPNLANATNRVGIFAQAMAGTLAFGRAGRLEIRPHGLLLISVAIGAIGGLYLASIISNEGFRSVYRWLLLVLFFIILSRPKQWLKANPTPRRISPWLAVPLYLALGFYAGFISMGMGVVFLAITVLLARFDMLTANVLKTVMVLMLAVMSLIWFIWLDWIDWRLGGLMAIGQAAGAYLTAHYASRLAWVNQAAYYLLIIVVGFALIRLWF